MRIIAKMKANRAIAVAVILLVSARMVHGYAVGPPLAMEALTAEADIIFKGTVTSIDPVQDEWFKPTSGFEAFETQFKIVSVIKGEVPGATIRFRHYDEVPSQSFSLQPQHYHFQTNRTYIVFARKTVNPAVSRQLWANHKTKEDQGVLLCPDDQPVKVTTMKEVFWNELTLLLKSGERVESRCGCSAWNSSTISIGRRRVWLMLTSS